MAFIRVIQEDEAEGKVRDLYEQYRAPWGGVDNILKIHSLLPSTLKPHIDLYRTVMFGKGPLTRRQREMIATVVSRENNCAYCVHHHSDALFRITKDRSLAAQLRLDEKTPHLSPGERCMLKYAARLTGEPSTDHSPRVQQLKDHGFTEEAILEVVGPGEVFGELSLVEEGAQRNELAETLDDALICAVKKEDFERLMREHPDLTLRITKRIGLRLRRFEERVTNLVFKDVKKRIASFLTEYAEDFGKMKGDIITVRMHLSHHEIGLLTGCARQTVTTVLNEFRNAGLIDFSREGLTIKQYRELQKLAD